MTYGRRAQIKHDIDQAKVIKALRVREGREAFHPYRKTDHVREAFVRHRARVQKNPIN